jgi:hypothetical protein
MISYALILSTIALSLWVYLLGLLHPYRLTVLVELKNVRLPLRAQRDLSALVRDSPA